MAIANKMRIHGEKLEDVTIDDGTSQIFSMEKSTCKKCYLLSARELSITWSSYLLYWTWKPLVESRLALSINGFAEVAELRTICWLEISSTVNTQMLSPKTFYGAYLIVKFAYRAYGLDTFPSEVSIQVGNIRSQGQVHLSRNERKKQLPKQLFGLNQVKASRTRMFQEEKEALFERKDGWVEIELGSFYNDGNDKEVNMSLKEVKSLHLKGGIIVEGIELRPKD
ncbi:F-box protein PP2-B15 [Ziziphus jujuba]|uniref:F-box protein PP2-B15 n=1 Tax=Ziziphus jujuba TaxID=326968 RepID=A0ABM3ZUG8_ZIZJJ|nr:F-box protein PP2-B15 [Ziziphus jujuba]